MISCQVKLKISTSRALASTALQDTRPIIRNESGVIGSERYVLRSSDNLRILARLQLENFEEVINTFLIGNKIYLKKGNENKTKQERSCTYIE